MPAAAAAILYSAATTAYTAPIPSGAAITGGRWPLSTPS